MELLGTTTVLICRRLRGFVARSVRHCVLNLNPTRGSPRWLMTGSVLCPKMALTEPDSSCACYVQSEPVASTTANWRLNMTIENCQPSESMDRLPQACTQAALRNASEESWT